MLKIVVLLSFLAVACNSNNVQEKTENDSSSRETTSASADSLPANNSEHPEAKKSAGAIDTLIKITKPEAGTLVQSPLKIRGKARGYWFFEGDFPVEIQSEDGETIAKGVAIAEGEWMTKDWVNFTAEINFQVKNEQGAKLIFHKQNASGNPERAREYEMPIRLQPSPK